MSAAHPSRPSGPPPSRTGSGPDIRVPRVPRTLLFVCVLAASGCMIGPDFVKPPTKLASRWTDTGDPSLADGEVGTADPHRDWWKVFDDPVLTQLVESAYQQSLTLQAAGVRVLEARAQLGVALGE